MARPGLTQHRKFRRLARALGSPLLALGALEWLWQSCYESGDDYLGTAEDIDSLLGWAGEKSGELALALVAAGLPEGHGFIEPIQSEHDGGPIRYRVHDLWHHAPEYVTKRRRREDSRRRRTDPVRPQSAVRPTVDDGRTPSPDWQIGVPPPIARGAGAGDGSGCISVPEGGSGETFRLDTSFELLKSLYPPNRVTSGHRTMTAFVDAMAPWGEEKCEQAFGRMLSNLSNQKRGHEWRVKGMIPSLEKWLRDGLWEQEHDPNPPAAEQLSPRTNRTLTAAAEILREGA